MWTDRPGPAEPGPALPADVALFTALRLADSLFPAGSFAFSWGLEGLFSEGEITRSGLQAFLSGSLEQKWLPFDAPFILAAHRASADLPGLAALDARIDPRISGTAAREGSLRSGGALLGLHERLGTPGAGALRSALRAQGGGHQAVVLGAMLAASGLGSGLALHVACYGYLSALCSAALRLGLVSHLDVQKALTALAGPVIAGLSRAIPDPGEATSFAPLAEIAMLRHAVRDGRLFTN